MPQCLMGCLLFLFECFMAKDKKTNFWTVKRTITRMFVSSDTHFSEDIGNWHAF